jgi:hypothetical protein
MGKGADEKINDALVKSRMTVRLLRGSYLSANDIGGTCALVTGRAVQEIALGGTPPRLQTWQHLALGDQDGPRRVVPGKDG